MYIYCHSLVIATTDVPLNHTQLPESIPLYSFIRLLVEDYFAWNILDASSCFLNALNLYVAHLTIQSNSIMGVMNGKFITL